MERQLVSKELYYALKRLTGSFNDDFEAIIHYATTFKFHGELKIINELTLKQLSSYLINGYKERGSQSE